MDVGLKLKEISVPVLLLTSCVIWDEYLTSLSRSLSILICRMGIYYYPLQWVAGTTPFSPQSAYMALSMYPATSTNSHFILLFFTGGKQALGGEAETGLKAQKHD